MEKDYNDVIFIVDNRTVNCNSFELEAGWSSCMSMHCSLLTSYLQSASMYPSVRSPVAVIIASSPVTTRIIQLPSQRDSHELRDLLAARFDARNTWSGFLVHAMSSIQDVLKRNPYIQTLLIIIQTNDLSLLSEEDIDAGVKRFLKTTTSFGSIKLNIRFLCPTISTLPNSLPVFEESILMDTLRNVFHDTSIIEPVKVFPNSGMYYEDELRGIYECLSTRVHCHLVLPQIGMCKLADLELDIRPFSRSAEEAMHQGLSKPLFYGLMNRLEVDPLHIKGNGLVARPYLLGNSHAANASVFYSLNAVLGDENALLILKVPYRETASQYWALVPSAVSDLSKQHMALIQLVHKEEVLRTIEPIRGVVHHEGSEDFKGYLHRALSSLGDKSTYNPLASRGGIPQPTIQQPSKIPQYREEPTTVSTYRSDMNKTTAGLSGLPSSKGVFVAEGVKQLNFGTTKPPAKRSIVMPTRTGRTASGKLKRLQTEVDSDTDDFIM